MIFPLLAPMSATVGIFAFLASWNDFMMPSLIIADSALQTLPVVQHDLPDAVQQQLQRRRSRRTSWPWRRRSSSTCSPSAG